MQGRRLEDERRHYANRGRERRGHREAKLRRIGFEGYSAYIKSSLWAETRRRYWRDPETQKVCGLCGTAEPPLALHHRTYERVGAEQLDDLIAICVACHHLLHELERRGDVDGLDTDLAVLTNAVRAARYRQQGRVAELRRSAENRFRREKILRRLANAQRELASAEDKRKPEHRIQSVRRRLQRYESQLRWLELHPALELDPLSHDHRVRERTRLRAEKREKAS